MNHDRHEWKFGVESDNTFLNEDFAYNITDPSQFDDNTPLIFAFRGNKPDLEQSAFVQDLIHLDKWTINAGLRWDHYQLETNNQAFSPRIAVSRYFPSAETVIHFSYDRVFQTPSFENILLSNSSEILSLDPTNFLRLPVEPSQGNYFEIGVSKSFWSKLKLDVNYYRRYVNNYADDDQISNTTISFPIAFRKSIIYGARRETLYSGLARILGTCQLFLYGGQRLVPGHRRTLLGRRCFQRHQSDHRPLSRFRKTNATPCAAASVIKSNRASGWPLAFSSIPVFPSNFRATLRTLSLSTVPPSSAA